jgi:hypothetical protein
MNSNEKNWECGARTKDSIEYIQKKDHSSSNKLNSIQEFDNLIASLVEKTLTIIGNGRMRNYCMKGFGQVDKLPWHDENIIKIKIDEGITKISYWAFMGLRGLTSVSFPKSLVQIEDGAFCNCSGLKTILLPEYLEIISSYTFSGCNGLMKIEIPENVEKIEEGAFEGCSNLKTIIIRRETPPELHESSFYRVQKTLKDNENKNFYVNENTTLYVPSVSLHCYKYHPLWGNFLQIKPIPEFRKVEEIENEISYLNEIKLKIENKISILEKKKADWIKNNSNKSIS